MLLDFGGCSVIFPAGWKGISALRAFGFLPLLLLVVVFSKETAPSAVKRQKKWIKIIKKSKYSKHRNSYYQDYSFQTIPFAYSQHILLDTIACLKFLCQVMGDHLIYHWLAFEFLSLIQLMTMNRTVSKMICSEMNFKSAFNFSGCTNPQRLQSDSYFRNIALPPKWL